MSKKPTGKQQKRAEKKRKQRTERRQELRRSSWEAKPKPRRGMSADETALRKSLLDFAFEPRFHADREQSIAMFFGEEAALTRQFGDNKEQTIEYAEWLIHDFITHEGEHIIDTFAREIAPSLPEIQRQMVAEWRQSTCRRLVEVVAVSPGIGETVQDLLTGEVFEGQDVTLSRNLRPGTVLFMRPSISEGVLKFTGAPEEVPPGDKELVLGFARELWDEYRHEQPDATVVDFYRASSLEFYRFSSESEELELPSILTPEGHVVVEASAAYIVRDADEVERRLDAAEEFSDLGADQEQHNVHGYAWLLRGRSQAPPAVEKPPLALVLDAQPNLGPTEEKYRLLGHVMLTRRFLGDSLELVCFSRERLAVGKVLVEEVLAGQIVHKQDRFEEFDLDTFDDDE